MRDWDLWNFSFEVFLKIGVSSLHVHIQRILIEITTIYKYIKTKAVVECNCLNILANSKMPWVILTTINKKIRIACVCGAWTAPTKYGRIARTYKGGHMVWKHTWSQICFLIRSNHQVLANSRNSHVFLCFDFW
jgi:hypothetical protein